MMNRAKVIPFLEKSFFVFVKTTVSDKGIERLSNIELLTKAAR